MDRNSLIGLGLIGGILILWLTLSGPSKEDIARNKRIQDSVMLAETKKAEAVNRELVVKVKEDSLKALADTVKAVTLSDSAKIALESNALTVKFKNFAVAAKGTEEFFTIENELLKATISSKGGKVAAVELKKYKHANKKDNVLLFDNDSTRQSLELHSGDRAINTDELYFTGDKKAVVVSGTETGSLKLKLATDKPGSYIEFIYSLKGGDYMMDYTVNMVALQDIIAMDSKEVDFKWDMNLRGQEEHIEKERQVATVYWKAVNEDPDYINPLKEEEKSIPESKLEWVAFKNQFFTSAVIAKGGFSQGSKLATVAEPTSLNYVKKIKSVLAVPVEQKGNVSSMGIRFYFGPNNYYILKGYDLGMEKMIPIGWSIFSFLNKLLIIPVFNWLKDSGISYGLIILVLTLIIKTLLFPIAYKTYLSSAKMRLLKPELDVINGKFGDDPVKKNQETMALYRKAGASPFSGCIPALIQIPILIALFNFFPASIELRQQGFLWADDLSTYDSIWSFGYVPVINSIYGDHVSLFALLMFVSTIVYTWMNQKLMPMNNTQMPGMQVMMYLMPVIFLSFMNSYSAGLSWYYFLANMITFAQTLLMRKFVDDKKLRAQIDQNMKKPVKKSGFQQRLEDMQKQRTKQISGKK